jgi:hypothetical protein
MTGRRAVPRPLRGGPDRAGQGRLAPASGGLRAVQQAVLRAFAAGQPPGPAARAAVPAGASVPGILAELAAGDYLVLDAGGQISAAYPFSAAPTPHRVRLPGGVTVHAMCAVDALGIAPMLGTDAVIASSDPGTAEPVTITVTAGHANWDPPGTVVLYAWRDCSGPAAATCCDLISFFTSRKAARTWARTRPQPGAVILTAAQASQLAADIFGPLLDSRH